jgi:methyl-accepting chemotaxis protein
MEILGDSARKKVDTAKSSSLIFTLTTLGIITFLFIIISGVMVRSIETPVKALVTEIEAIGNGNFTNTILVYGNDELSKRIHDCGKSQQ